MANRIQPPRDFNWGRTLRTLLVLGAAHRRVHCRWCSSPPSRRQDAVDMPYCQFTEAARDAGNVVTVEITERQLRGDLKRAGHRSHTARPSISPRCCPFESSDSPGSRPCGRRAWTSRAQGGRSSRSASFLFSFLPYLLIFGLIIFMLRQMQQGGNRAFAFGKSKAKLLVGRHAQGHVCRRRGCRRGEARSSRRSSTSSRTRRSSSASAAASPRARC